MNRKNDYIRDYLGVSVWHKAGYTGSRCTVLTGEVFEGDEATSHGKSTREALLEIAPDAKVLSAPFPSASNRREEFLEVVEATGASAMFYSMSTTSFSASNALDAEMPERFFLCVSAGNYASERANSYMRPKSVYGVGAVTVRWSATRNGVPMEDAKLLVSPASYTSHSDLVDFAAPTGLYLASKGGTQFNGTSCSCPVLVGLATLVNDFFIEKTGSPLSHSVMYQFLHDHSEDVYSEGKDKKTGWGIPRLPDPSTIDIAKYVPDYFPEEDLMDYETFCKFMARYEAERSAKPEPAWSMNGGSWTKAQEAGVMDGSRPEDPVKRVELAAVMDRLGLIKR